EEEAIKVTKKKNLENDIVDETLEVDETLTKEPLEPKNVNEALGDESWIVAMQEELNQFIANECWVLRNKLDENGVVSQNNARLVAQGYNQQEGIDYDET
ncbi:hypothetical protein Tco_0202367, partial [Tanacetum coccineum]